MSTIFNGPSDPELAKLWTLAVAKERTRLGRDPETVEEWNSVVAELDKLRRKRRGSLGENVAAVREYCVEVSGGD